MKKILLLLVIGGVSLTLPARTYNKLGYKTDIKNLARIIIDTDFNDKQWILDWIDTKKYLKDLPVSYQQVTINTTTSPQNTLIINKNLIANKGRYRRFGAPVDNIYPGANLEIAEDSPFDLDMLEHEYQHALGRGHDPSIQCVNRFKINSIITIKVGTNKSFTWADQWIENLILKDILHGGVYGYINALPNSHLEFRRINKKFERVFEMDTTTKVKEYPVFTQYLEEDGYYEIELPQGKYEIYLVENKEAKRIRKRFKLSNNQNKNFTYNK